MLLSQFATTVFRRIVSAETILFWKCKMWKFSYSFQIVAIFYFIDWIVATETINGGKLFKWGNYSRKYGMLLNCTKCKFYSWITTGHNLSRTNLCAVWSNKKNGQAGWHISRRISKASCSTGYPRKQDKKDFTKDKKQTKIPSRMIWSKFF